MFDLFKKFSYQFTLKEHLKIVHEEVQLLYCDICNVAIKRKADLYKHIKKFSSKN